MSMNCSIAKLESKYKKRIVACLYQNGCDRASIDLLMKEGKLKDIADMVDFEDIFY